MARNLYAEVTAKILAELEAGALPWIKPWKSTGNGNMPRNAVTKRPYSGSNIVILWMACEGRSWPTMDFLTFKQALDAGGNVRKGETGTTVCFVSSFRKEEDGQERNIGFLKAFTVFNVAQCENLPESVTGGGARIVNTEQRDHLADAFVRSTGADIREGAGEAFYTPAKDFISMPSFGSFVSSDAFYATEFHEIGHWTGHQSRLNRDIKNRFGERLYAAEELVAELTSAFLCAEFGFDGKTRHAGYIESWIKLLKDDEKAFFKAASAAQKAADFLRSQALREDCPQAVAA